MNTVDYQKKLNQDLHTLKNATFDILPASIFYRDIGIMVLKFYTLVVGFPWFITILLNEKKLSLTFYMSDWIILSVLFSLMLIFFLPQMAQYITIKKTVFPLLNLAPQLSQGIKIYFAILITTSILWSSAYTFLFFPTDFSHVGERAFTLIPGLLLGIFIASTLFQMELARVGLCTLYGVISNFKNTSQTTNK